MEVNKQNFQLKNFTYILLFHSNFQKKESVVTILNITAFRATNFIRMLPANSSLNLNIVFFLFDRVLGGLWDTLTNQNRISSKAFEGHQKNSYKKFIYKRVGIAVKNNAHKYSLSEF